MKLEGGAMKTVNFVLSGLGGQGVLFMTKILAHAALRKGLKVMGAETHGMAQRGGSVISHLRIGDVESSLVRTGSAHFLLALEESEAYRNIPFCAEGGGVYANAGKDRFPRPEVKPFLEKKGVRYHCVPAEEIAMSLGTPMSSNLALLGFFSSFKQGPLSHEELRETIDQVSPDRFKEVNLKVFDAGFEAGSEESS